MPARPREQISPSSSQNSKKITEMGLLFQFKDYSNWGEGVSF